MFIFYVLNFIKMKKNIRPSILPHFFAILLVFAFSLSSWGQTERLVNGNFEGWNNSSSPTSWTHVENVAEETTEIHGGTYSAKHTGGTKDLGQTITGIVGGFSR